MMAERARIGPLDEPKRLDCHDLALSSALPCSRGLSHMLNITLIRRPGAGARVALAPTGLLFLGILFLAITCVGDQGLTPQSAKVAVSRERAFALQGRGPGERLAILSIRHGASASICVVGDGHATARRLSMNADHPPSPSGVASTRVWSTDVHPGNYQTSERGPVAGFWLNDDEQLWLADLGSSDPDANVLRLAAGSAPAFEIDLEASDTLLQVTLSSFGKRSFGQLDLSVESHVFDRHSTSERALGPGDTLIYATDLPKGFNGISSIGLADCAIEFDSPHKGKLAVTLTIGE